MSRTHNVRALGHERPLSFTPTVVLYGLLSYRLCEVIEWYPTIEEVQTTLAEILSDEPSWRPELEIVEMEIDLCPN